MKAKKKEIEKEKPISPGKSSGAKFPLDARVYFDIFQMNPAGMSILEELSMLFNDRPSVVKRNDGSVDANGTLVKEGERNPIIYIINKCAEAQK